MRRSGERAANRQQHLIEDRLELRRQRCFRRRDRGRIEERLRIGRAAAKCRTGLRRQVERAGGFGDLLRKLMREHGTEDRDPDGAADVPPELDLARDDAEVLEVDSALRGVEIERHADADAETDKHEVAHDLHLGRADIDLRKQVQAEHHHDHAERPEVAIPLHADHELPGDDARGDEPDHERRDEET